MATSRVNYLTYKGRAYYPWLQTPDTQFHDEGVYKTGLKVPADQATEIMEAAKAVAVEALGAKRADGCRYPWKADEETGEIVFTAKSRYKPKFFDSKGMLIPEGQVPRLYSGSVLRLKGSITSYDKGANAGVLMNLSEVQVIEPVTEPQGTSEGFDAVDGGYTHEAGSFQDETPSNGSTSKEDFDADF